MKFANLNYLLKYKVTYQANIENLLSSNCRFLNMWIYAVSHPPF